MTARSGTEIVETATLWGRLRQWGQETHGWDGRLGIKAEMPQPVSATIGPVTGYGRTTNEAINSLADGLADEGWPDDREYCQRCEGDGVYSQLADCTTFDPDCACNGPRVSVDPCPDCGGSGYV